MSERDAPGLGAILELVAARGGAVLSPQQRDRVLSAAKARRRTHELVAWAARLGTREGQGELDELVAATAVHTTELFRDEVQLLALSQHVLKPLAQTGRPLAVWSAGCSTGEEVATLLVLLAEAGAHTDSRVLGTDLSASALERAKALTFSEGVARKLPEQLRRRYFLSQKGSVAVAPTLASKASFQRHNLTETPYPYPPSGGPFDLIVCRNVLIYLTPEVIDFVLARLAERLSEEGVLLLAAAEPILDPRDDLMPRRIGEVFIYHRSRGPKARPSAPAPRPSGPAWLPSRGASVEPSRRTLPDSGPLPLPFEVRTLVPRASAPKAAPVPSLELRPTPRPSTPPASSAVPFDASTGSGLRLGPVPPAEEAPRPSVPPPRPSTRPGAPKLAPEAEGQEIFEHVLEWAHTHRTPAETESMLRQALYLAPGLAAARYVLGLHLEQHGQRALAQDEFRRALAALDAKSHLSTPFFLNDERLMAACKMAMERLDARPPRRP